MLRAIIFANGRLDDPPPMIREINPSDLVIAADGGTYHCKLLGITPNVIIGDFDSLDSKDVTIYQQAGVKLIQYPTHKDETDLELALHLILKYKITNVFILGALGARWDMTIANILLASHPAFSQLSIRFLDGSQELVTLRGQDQIDISGIPGSLISLIPIAGDAHGVTTHGLEYPLNDETLYFGTSRGVSNVFLQTHARVMIRKGILLICFTNGEVNESILLN
jgi:thiamine pyrophosphokinase